MSARPLLLAVVLVFAGCGGDEESTTTSAAPSTQTSTTTTTTSTAQSDGGGGPAGRAKPALGSPTASVEAALTSTVPGVACDQAITATYLRVAYGSQGGCTAAVRSGAQAGSVRIASVDASGDRATVKAVPSGGPSDGDTLDVSLVLDGATWKVDSIHSNAPVGP